MDASQILKHPFITDDLSSPNTQSSSKISGVFATSQSEKPERITSICEPSLAMPWPIAPDQNANNRPRPLSEFAMHFNRLDRRKVILGDMNNIDTRKPNVCNRFLPTRRVVSDPASFKTTLYGISEEKPTNSDSTLKSDASLTKEKHTLSTEVLPVTHDVALPFQNSIERPQLPMKPPKSIKNLNKIHSIPPPVSHAHRYRELFFIGLAAPYEQHPFAAYRNNSPPARKYVVACAKDPQIRKWQPYYPSISFLTCRFSGEPTTTRAKRRRSAID